MTSFVNTFKQEYEQEMKEKLAETFSAVVRNKRTPYVRKTYITLGSQGPPQLSRIMQKKVKTFKKKNVQPQRDFATFAEERKFKSIALKRNANIKRLEERIAFLSKKKLTAQDLQSNNLIRLFGYGPYTGRLFQQVWSEAANWVRKKASWREMDRTAKRDAKQERFTYRKAFWVGADLRNDDSAYTPDLRSWKTARKWRVPKERKLDNRAAAKVLWLNLERPQRSTYLLAKLHQILDRLRDARKACPAFVRAMRNENAEAYLKMCFNTAKLGNHQINTRQCVDGMEHKFVEIDEHGITRCIYCGQISRGRAKLGRHEMDIQNDPIGEVGTEHQVMGNVTLEQQSVTPVVAQIGRSLADTACAEEVVDACPELVERGLYLDTLTWSTAQNTDAAIPHGRFDLISGIISRLKSKDTPNLLMFDVFRYSRADIELTFTANTTMFHSGMLQISVTYLKDATKNTSYYDSIYTLSQRHHVILNAGAGNEVSIKVPWDYYKSFLYFDDKDSQGGRDFATVLVKVLSPLATNSASASSVDVMVYVKLSKVNFTGMIPKRFAAFKHEMDIIGPAARVVTAFLADPNRDYPSVPGAKVIMQPQSSQSLCYGTNADHPTNVLRMDPSVQTPHPQKLVDFNLNTVKSVWGLIKTIPSAITLNSSIGTIIWQTEVSPILPTSSLFECEPEVPFNPGNGAVCLATYAYPPVSVLGSMYGYWRGSLEFKIQIVQTKFHSGRIMIGFIPGAIPSNITINIDDLRNCMHTVYNLQDSNEIIFRVPYLSHTPVQPRFYVNGTFGSSFPSIGTLYVMVANKLALSDNVVSHVGMNIYFRGGSDLEFYHPVSPSLIPGTSRVVQVRGILAQWISGHVAVGVGVWKTWTLDGKEYPIFRYGDVTDHVAQLQVNVFGVYDVGTSHMFKYWYWTDQQKKALALFQSQWIVPVRFGGYTYAVPFPSEAVATKYCKAVTLERFVKGDMNTQLGYYAKLMPPPRDTKTLDMAGEPFTENDRYVCTYAKFEHESMRDSSDAMEIVNVTPAGPLGKTLFGEKLCGLKDLTRRYQFVGSMRKVDTDVHDNPLYTDIVIPVCPTFQTNDAPPYDRLGVHPTALLSSGFRGFRGSLRYKFVFRSKKPAVIYVQHRFDSRPRNDSHIKYVHGLDDLIGTGYATFVQHTSVNSIFDVEVPYYSIYNYLVVGPQSDSANDHEKTTFCNGNLLVSVDSDEAWTLDIWSAFADDASLHMFQGFPPMAVTSGLPLDLVPETLVPKLNLESSFEKLGVHEGLMDYVPGVNLYKKLNHTLDSVNNCAESVQDISSTAISFKEKVTNAGKSVSDFVMGIPSIAASIGIEAWNSLLQILQVYINPSGKAIAICVMSILINICSKFKDYAEGLFNALTALFKGHGMFEAVDAFMESTATDAEEEECLLKLLKNPDSTEPNEGSGIPKKMGFHQLKLEFDEDKWIPITSLLVTAVSGVCGKKSPSYNPGTLIKSAIASIPDQAKNTMFVVKYIAILINLVKTVSEHVKRYFWPEATTLDVPDKSLNAWYKLCCELTDVTKYDVIRLDQTKVDQVYTEVKRGESIVVVASSSDDKQIRAIAPLLRAKLDALRKVKQQLYEERITATSYTTPFCVWMYGRPGIGKSVGGAKIRADLLRSAGIKAVGEVSYTVSPGKKHLDGLSNQPCLIFDDFGAINDATKTPELIQMYMEIISSEPYRPPMANLTEKKIVHNAELVYINSNLAYPRYPCVADADAFNRRRHALVYVKAKEDPLTFNDVKDLPMPEMIPGSLDHLEFAFMDPRDQSSELRLEQQDFLTYAEFIELLKEKFNTHRERAIELASERMIEEEGLRAEAVEIQHTFESISTAITASMVKDHSAKIGVHQIDIKEDDDKPSIEPCSEDEDDGNFQQAYGWELASSSRDEGGCVSYQRDMAAAGLSGHAGVLLGDSALRARARVTNFDDGTNTPQALERLVERRTEVSDVEFALMRAEAILAGRRLDTSVCLHDRFSTVMHYEEGVFVGNQLVLGNTPCDPMRAPDCRWLDSKQYAADMVGWFAAHSQEMLTRIEIIKINRSVTEDDIPPYFVKIFANVDKEQKLIADAEQSWLKTVQYYISYSIPRALVSIFEFVRRHMIAILIIVYVVFLVTMMGLGTYASVQEIKQGNYPTARGPQVYRPPYVHQVVPSGDNHTQRVSSARKITAQLIKSGAHEIEMNQQNKDVLRLTSANTWFICCVNDKDEILCEVRVLAIKGRQLLIIRHFAEYLTRLLGKSSTNRLVLARPSCILPWNYVDFSTIQYKDAEGEGALGLIEGPATMPLARDISGLLAPAKFHDGVDLSDVVLGVFEMGHHPSQLIPALIPMRAWIDSVTAQAEAGMSEVTYTDGYMYPFGGRGTCGSVLVAGGFVIGVHVAGWNGNGISQPICREWFKEQVKQEISPLFPAKYLDITESKLLLSTSNLPLGVCEPAFAHHESGKTQIIPSKIYGVFPVTTEPAPLINTDPRLEGEFKGKSPMLAGCEKHGELVSDFPQALLNQAADDLTSHLISVVKPVRSKTGVLSLTEAIMGFPGRSEYSKMEMNTSEGYPWKGQRPPGAHNKKWLFSFGTDSKGQETLEGINQTLLAAISVNDDLRRRGIKPHTVYTDCTKDARIAKEKCKRADKTRIFSISPVDHTIACRQYFQDFSAAYQKSRFENECGVGIVVQGPEWTSLHTYLNTHSPYIVCGDYSNFGPGLQSGAVRAAFKIIADWYIAHGATPEETLVRKVLGEENVNSIHQMFNLLYHTCGGAPSGNPLTVIINSLVNCLYIRMAWKEITGMPFTEYYRYVRLVTYGDDLIMSVSPQVIDKFNNKTLQNFFKRYQIKYTDIDKGDGEIRLYCTISEASFLKRSFIPHPSRAGQFLACAEIQSVEDCANWVRRAPDLNLATLVNATTCCDIAYSRGKEYHSKVVKAIHLAWNKHRRSDKSAPILKTRTWEELDALYYSDEWEGQPWTEQHLMYV
uniref:Genome polyprotein n=1 Tax=Frankliniella occidentalis associated iflavirus 1 TaxID=2767214 RepID=A0A7G9IR78_9VIRU|nr:hypothetical protein [Frankliniella occidentalis associated iflavirus 1]